MAVVVAYALKKSDFGLDGVREDSRSLETSKKICIKDVAKTKWHTVDGSENDSGR